MAISQILTLGYGSFGGVNYLPTLGYQAGAARVTTETFSGGYDYPSDGYKRKRREESIEELPKAVKKAIKVVAKLGLPDKDAEIALRLRTQQSQWNNLYLQHLKQMQATLKQSLALEQQQLINRQLYGAQLTLEAKRKAEQEAQEDRDLRIQIIMQLI